MCVCVSVFLVSVCVSLCLGTGGAQDKLAKSRYRTVESFADDVKLMVFLQKHVCCVARGGSVVSVCACACVSVCLCVPERLSVGAVG